MTKRMTACFEYDVRKHAQNPFHTQTPFGSPVTVSDGDEFQRADKLETRNEALSKALQTILKYDHNVEVIHSIARTALGAHHD